MADPDPLDRLPHTGPARLPERVIQLEPGVLVVAETRLGRELPAMMLIELMAQTGGLLVDDCDARPGDYAVLAGVRRMHLHAMGLEGDLVTAECRLSRKMGELYMLKCEARTGSQPLAHGEILIRRVRDPG